MLTRSCQEYARLARLSQVGVRRSLDFRLSVTSAILGPFDESNRAQVLGATE